VNADTLAERLSKRLDDVILARGEVTVIVERGKVLTTLKWLRDTKALAFEHLSDCSATHWLEREPAFWVAYHLYSPEHGHRVRVKVGLSEGDAVLPSVTGLFPTANWQEREVFDLDGIVFEGHPDLRRILMPDDWEGYPLRKDYALGGTGTQYKGAFIPPVDERRS
jgi:NADH-quinone oxidoreductase subunit C